MFNEKNKNTSNRSKTEFSASFYPYFGKKRVNKKRYPIFCENARYRETDTLHNHKNKNRVFSNVKKSLKNRIGFTCHPWFYSRDGKVIHILFFVRMDSYASSPPIAKGLPRESLCYWWRWGDKQKSLSPKFKSNAFEKLYFR